MAENTKTRRLSVATIIFVSIIVIGLLSIRKPEFEYSLTPQQTVSNLENRNYFLNKEITSQIIHGAISDVVLIDLRNPDDFDKGHIKGAINIPVSEILAGESIDFLNNAKVVSKQVVLYEDDILLANGAGMVLRQIGYDNVAIIAPHNLKFRQLSDNTERTSQSQQYRIEKASYNFSEIIKSNISNSSTLKNDEEFSREIKPVRREKKSQTAGGC